MAASTPAKNKLAASPVDPLTSKWLAKLTASNQAQLWFFRFPLGVRSHLSLDVFARRAFTHSLDASQFKLESLDCTRIHLPAKPADESRVVTTIIIDEDKFSIVESPALEAHHIVNLLPSADITGFELGLLLMVSPLHFASCNDWTKRCRSAFRASLHVHP
jgi:hypothetical protein